MERRQEQRDTMVKSSTSLSAMNEDNEAPPSHIFDGVHLNTETAAFQLCDIIDPMLKEMIKDEDAVRDECNVSLEIFFSLFFLTLIYDSLYIGTRWLVYYPRPGAHKRCPSIQILFDARRSHSNAGGM